MLLNATNVVLMEILKRLERTTRIRKCCLLEQIAHLGKSFRKLQKPGHLFSKSKGVQFSLGKIVNSKIVFKEFDQRFSVNKLAMAMRALLHPLNFQLRIKQHSERAA